MKNRSWIKLYPSYILLVDQIKDVVVPPWALIVLAGVKFLVPSSWEQLFHRRKTSFNLFYYIFHSKRRQGLSAIIIVYSSFVTQVLLQKVIDSDVLLERLSAFSFA